MLSKSNPGLGSSSSLKSEPTQPNSGGAAESSDSSEKSKWEKISLAAISPQADFWFQDLNPVPLKTHLAKPLAAAGDTMSMVPLLRDESLNILPQMRVDLEDLGELLELTESKIGRVLLGFLDLKGVNYSLQTIFQLNHFQRVDLEGKSELVGSWGTDFQTPFTERVKIYRGADGKETAFWFTHLMASNLPIETEDGFSFREDDGSFQRYGHSDALLEAGAMTTGEWSTQIYLPEFLKRLAFMSETPFPSTAWLTSFSRDLCYKDTPAEARPIPTFVIEHQAACEGYASEISAAEGQMVHWSSIYPDVVLFGWRFGEESLPYFEDIVPTIADGLVYAVSTVEDGYKNFRNDDYPADWDSTLGSPAAHYAEFERGGEARGLPRWFAATDIGDEHFKTENLMVEAQEADAVGDQYRQFVLLNQVVNNGVGPYVTNAINTLIYSHYVPRLPHEPELMEIIEELADKSLSLEVLNETTNTMANMGIAYMVLGDDARAIAAFEAALERTDEYAESEASFFLAEIYERQGNAEKAVEYREREAEAGGYEAPDWFQPLGFDSRSAPPAAQAASGLGHERAGSQPRAKFCSQCGTKFEGEAVNFCPSCGTRRD
jgi:rubrerythrin